MPTKNETHFLCTCAPCRFERQYRIDKFVFALRIESETWPDPPSGLPNAPVLPSAGDKQG